MLRALLALASLLLLLSAEKAYADKQTKFGVTLGLGEAYGLGLARVSFGSFDLSIEPRLLSAGTRLWKGSTYAGFGGGFHLQTLAPGWYGLIGYEWRPIRVMGVIFEMNGSSTFQGHASAFATVGVTVGW